MEVHEPDEVVVEVSVVKQEEEAPAPKESVLPGSEEGEGRHRVATRWTRILQMDDKKFNYALKVIFVVFPLSHGLITLLFINFLINRPYIVELPDQGAYEGFPMETLHLIIWLFVAMALCFALLALVLDVERTGLKCRPVPKWMVRLAEGTCSKLQECYHLTTEELLPHHRAAHEEASQEHSGLA